MDAYGCFVPAGSNPVPHLLVRPHQLRTLGTWLDIVVFIYEEYTLYMVAIYDRGIADMYIMNVDELEVCNIKGIMPVI